MFTEMRAQECSDFVPAYLFNAPVCNTAPFILVFEDNFDGTTLDLDKWQVTPFAQGALQPYYDDDGNLHDSGDQEYQSLNNVEVSNGTCKVIAKHETVMRRAVNWKPAEEILEDGLPNYRQYNYTSAILWSLRNNFFRGRYDIRCRMPAGQGFWPAYWTYGEPPWNELDMFELHGNNTSEFTCNAHHDYYQDGSNSHCAFSMNTGLDLTDWHVYSCVFDFGQIQWFIDGNLVRTLASFYTVGPNHEPIACGDNIGTGVYGRLEAIPMKQMNLIFGMGIQNGGSSPNETTPFPSTFEIDYVRFYEREGTIHCDDCIDNYLYLNTSTIATETSVNQHIGTSGTVVLHSGHFATFRAGESIDLSPGFISEPGSIFQASIGPCVENSFPQSGVDFIGTNAINDYLIRTCENPTYELYANGVTQYYFEVHNIMGQLVAVSSGNPESNIIQLWDAYNVATGWYSAHLELYNCELSDIRNYTLGVEHCQNGFMQTSENNAVNVMGNFTT